MNEVRWTEEGAAPPAKKAIPTWAWWVGGGCGFLLLVCAVGVFVVVTFVKRGRDEERQWPLVAEVLPFDKRPENLHLEFGLHVGADMFIFREQHGYVVLLMQMPEDKERSREKMFDVKESFSVFGKGGRHSMQEAKLHVQGRELKALRFVQEGAQSGAPGTPSTGTGGSILVDLTPEDAERALLLQVTRIDGDDKPIEDQTVVDILAPFHVGPQR